MTNEQLLLVICVPVLFNGIAIALLGSRISSVEGRISSLENSLNKRIDDLAHHVDKRFDDLHAFLRVVMSKVDELDHRVTKLEQS